MHVAAAVETVSVVLIEDNLADAHLIKQMVRGHSYPSFEVAHARSLEAGRLSVESAHPDAVLLDLNLPECRGLETLRRIRSVDEHTPIVVLTGVDDTSLALAAMDAGAQDYLVKGAFNHEVLTRSLRYAIARAKQTQLYRATLQRLARIEKLEAVGRLASGVVHDFNNLLTIMQSHSTLLRRNQDPEVFEHAQSIQSAIAQAAGLTDQLLAFCRGRPHRRTTVDLSSLVLSMQPMLRRLIDEQIHLDVGTPVEPVHVIADRGQLEQVVLNLVLNARDAVGSHGEIKLHIESTRGKSGALAGRSAGLIRVSDDGPGMDDDTKAHIFEPFFTTKDYGHGLGLASVFGIVEQSGGSIEVESAPGTGSEFRVFLPAPPSSSQRFAAVRVSSPPAPQPPPAARTLTPMLPPPTPTSRERSVLLIEDDALVRDVVCVALQQVGYRVIAAGDSAEALALAQAHGSQMHCIISELALSDTPTSELVARVSRHCPGAPVLFVAGWGGADPSLPQLDVPTALLQKPFSSHDMLRALDKLQHP